MKEKEILKIRSNLGKVHKDVVAIEEPLEIGVVQPKGTNGKPKPISITMRTPGQDVDLALGFLMTEGVIESMDSIQNVVQVDENHILVKLPDHVVLDVASLDRNFYTTSSCGVCGKSSIEAIGTSSNYRYPSIEWNIPVSRLYGLQSKVKSRQLMFKETGGIHSAAFFNLNAEFIDLAEDVGRHNALDKLIGRFLQSGNLPLDKGILFLSGRASFELIQKASMAGVCMVTAVGAPSSLAIELAEDTGITLIGFLKEDSCNVYSHSERIALN